MIELRRVEDLTVVTLSAGKANALEGPLLDALTHAIDTALADGARALIVTGDGNSFSGGLALPALIDFDRDQLRALMATFTTAMRRILEAPVPVVAAINGNAIAGGCVIALMCDERIMVGAGPKGPPKIGLNESQLGIGLPPIVTEVVRMKLRAQAFVPVALEGRLFAPDEARGLGLVDDVVAPDQLQSRVLARAAALTTAAPLAYAQIKRLMLAPTLEAVTRLGAAETERWLDTWFSVEGQRRLRDAVARIIRR
jgi:enoyl-CoA hydratase